MSQTKAQLIASDATFTISSDATINDVTVGKHDLKGEVTNNPRYGKSWYDNPGGIAWLLRNSSGAIVRTSTHDFNTQLPQGFRAVAFGVSRMAGDINKITFEGMNFTASGDITNTTTDVQNAVVEEGILNSTLVGSVGAAP